MYRKTSIYACKGFGPAGFSPQLDEADSWSMNESCTLLNYCMPLSSCSWVSKDHHVLISLLTCKTQVSCTWRSCWCIQTSLLGSRSSRNFTEIFIAHQSGSACFSLASIVLAKVLGKVYLTECACLHGRVGGEKALVLINFQGLHTSPVAGSVCLVLPSHVCCWRTNSQCSEGRKAWLDVPQGTLTSRVEPSVRTVLPRELGS